MIDSSRLLRLAMFTCGVALSAGCGDDGGGGDGEASSTGAASTGGSTMPEVQTTTGAGQTTSGSSSGTPEDSSGTSSPGSTGESAGSESTGAPGDCAARDAETCEAMEGCVWVGNPQNGECLPEDPSVCPALEMQPCQQHPACDWSNQDMACAPA